MAYTRLEELGQGGFGKVYKVKGNDGREYALKTLEPLDNILREVSAEELQKRFSREVRYQSAIDHPNVLRVIDFNLDDNPPYCVLELADCSLQDELQKDRTLGGDPGKPLFDILAGLETLADHGYVHRDLKPQNVLRITRDGDERYAISDFGLMTAGNTDSTTLTGTNAGGGTIHYAAPELLGGFRRATTQADIYSFGAILHDIFNGEPRIPYTEVSAPPPIGPIIERCTKKNAVRRFGSVAELREALYEALDAQELRFGSDREERAVQLLRDKDELSDEEWDSVYAALEENEHRGQSNHNIYRVLRQPHIEHLANTAPPVFKAFGIACAEYISTDSFPFEYCDVLAAKAQAFYDRGDVELRATIILAVLILGVSHNRWAVEERFMRLAGVDADDAVIARFLTEVEVQQRDIEKLISHVEKSINTSRTRLHPLVQSHLAK
ncbi:serine/threonine protein kinase [Salinisphaera sp. PC39]|uniref:serine/threonine-protein kinase n=1 Tax=Salinisphaera sp. PC39 TaxID=1304156 RepID=UPI00333EFB65